MKEACKDGFIHLYPGLLGHVEDYYTGAVFHKRQSEGEKKHERKKENKWATESNTSNIMAQLINRTEGNLPLSEPRQRTSTPSLSALIWLVCVCVCVCFHLDSGID